MSINSPTYLYRIDSLVGEIHKEVYATRAEALQQADRALNAGDKFTFVTKESRQPAFLTGVQQSVIDELVAEMHKLERQMR
jgi:hypothetical protein